MVLQIFVDILTCTTGGTFQQLYKYEKLVRWAVIQNLTTTASTLVTLTSTIGTTNPPGGSTAAQGELLNAGSAAGVGGGSLTLPIDPNGDSYDLSQLWWTVTNSSDKISVMYAVSKN